MERATDQSLFDTLPFTLSEEYETKQKEYLQRLDKVMKWEEED